jgi:hypothetical protein
MEALAKSSTMHLNRRNQERTENNFSVASAASGSTSTITGFGPVCQKADVIVFFLRSFAFSRGESAFFIRGIRVIRG